MSLRKFSRKFKKSFNKNLNRLAFHVDESLSSKKKVWHVLITGGSGHLAYHLVRKLIEHVGDEIRPDVVAELASRDSPVVDRYKRKQMLKLVELEVLRRMGTFMKIVLLDVIEPNEELLKNDFVSYVRGSFTNSDIMNVALENIVTVFHLAAVGMTGQYATDRKACMDINAVGTMNLLIWCRQKNVKRFIYSSSVGVIFDGKPLNNAIEDLHHPDKFYNFYCESKAHAEIIVQNASCPELKTTVLRFNGIYGPGEKRVTERAVNFMLSGWWIGICKPNGVEAMTQLSSVDNCVQGLVKAELALRAPNCKHAQIYNIMDKDPVGTFTFWAPLNKALGFTDSMISIHPSLLRLGGVFFQCVADFFKMDPVMTSLEVDLLTVNNTFSIEKAINEIGYKPAPSAMPEIVEMYRGNYQSPIIKKQRKEQFIYRMIILSIALLFLFGFIVFLIYKTSGTFFKYINLIFLFIGHVIKFFL